MFGYDESMSWAVNGPWIMTSPNTPWIPFFLADRASVRLRTDGRFGDEDFTLAPQIYCREYAHRILVRKFPGEDCVESVMWWTPQSDNFEQIPGSCYRELGRLRSNKLKTIDAMTWNLRNRVYALISRNPLAEFGSLESLVANMRFGVMRLKHSPYTFRELVLDVAQTQRLYLDALALCDYLEDDWEKRSQSLGPVPNCARPEFMGAWTADASVVQQLQRAGVPVYFVQLKSSVGHLTAEEHKQCFPKRDAHIVTADWDLPVLYSGLPGAHVHKAMSKLNDYGDLKKFFFDIDGIGTVRPVGYRGSEIKHIEHKAKGRSRKNKNKSTGTNIY